MTGAAVDLARAGGPDAEIAALVEEIVAAGWPEELQAARLAMEAEGPPLSPDIAVEPAILAGRPAQWLRAPGCGAEAGIVLYLHGGGYSYGSLTSHQGLVGEIARGTGGAAVQLDYRLAPEHPYPAGLTDALTAYRDLLAAGHAAEGIALVGDSAGGGMVLALMLALRDAGDPLPRAAVCLSPWVDLTVSGESYGTRADSDPMIDAELAGMLAQWYAPGQDLRDPLISPLYGDLAGLPPLLIQVGAREVLFSEAESAARRAAAAGVPVIFEEWPAMIHVWHLYFHRLTRGRDAIARLCAFLRDPVAATSDQKRTAP